VSLAAHQPCLTCSHSQAVLAYALASRSYSVTGSDHLRKEGQAQQHKGHHEQKAAEAQAVAEKHELQAELFEDEERARQGVRRDMPDEPAV